MRSLPFEGEGQGGGGVGKGKNELVSNTTSFLARAAAGKGGGEVGGRGGWGQGLAKAKTN